MEVEENCLSRRRLFSWHPMSVGRMKLENGRMGSEIKLAILTAAIGLMIQRRRDHPMRFGAWPSALEIQGRSADSVGQREQAQGQTKRGCFETSFGRVGKRKMLRRVVDDKRWGGKWRNSLAWMLRIAPSACRKSSGYAGSSERGLHVMVEIRSGPKR